MIGTVLLPTYFASTIDRKASYGPIHDKTTQTRTKKNDPTALGGWHESNRVVLRGPHWHFWPKADIRKFRSAGPLPALSGRPGSPGYPAALPPTCHRRELEPFFETRRDRYNPLGRTSEFSAAGERHARRLDGLFLAALALCQPTRAQKY